jgi:hypothetical protein
MIIIIAGIFATLLLTLIFTRLFSKKQTENSPETTTPIADADCCGAHEVCDKETLLSDNDKIIYYQDEELDAHRLKNPSAYTTGEIEQFREVLYTMRDDEVAGWLRSLQLRGIYPPNIVREEALMIVEEIRGVIRGKK